MKKIVFIIIVLFANVAFAQTKLDRFDVRFGVGTSLLGTGDMITTTLETELNYKLNSYFTAAVSAASGKGANGVFEQASFFQGNLNAFFSPFRNDKINDFRIGGGLSYNGVSDVYRISSIYENGQPISSEYRFDNRRSFGGNIIIENTLAIANKYLLGVKAFTQPFFNGDINSGIVLKLGVKI
jgi:hypothetical protein